LIRTCLWGNITGALEKDVGEFDGKMKQLAKLNRNRAGLWAFNRGNGMMYAKKWADAAGFYREAIELLPSYTAAYDNLNTVLQIQGDFTSSLGPQTPVRLVKERKSLANLEAKLPSVLGGMLGPADADERIGLAKVCQAENRQFYRTATRMYDEAFVARPAFMTDNFGTQDNRWFAACAAALAGCGRGKDATNLEPDEYSRLRGQALAWLQADLQDVRKSVDDEYPQVHGIVRHLIQEWQREPYLNDVHGASALAKLPEAERREWQKLWADVEEVRKRAAGGK
jgi:hypothetical protein